MVEEEEEKREVDKELVVIVVVAMLSRILDFTALTHFIPHGGGELDPCSQTFQLLQACIKGIFLSVPVDYSHTTLNTPTHFQCLVELTACA